MGSQTHSLKMKEPDIVSDDGPDLFFLASDGRSGPSLDYQK
jgi:hypothetical protein